MFDKTTKLKSEIIKHKNQTVLITEDMLTSEPIEVDLGGADIEIISRTNATIQLNNKISGAIYQEANGNFKIKNAGSVRIIGVKFNGVRTGNTNYPDDVDNLGYDKPLMLAGDGNSNLSNVVIEDCKSLYMEGCTSENAVFAGLRVNKVDKVTLINNIIEHNTYAGCIITKASQTTAIGNSFSYNGASTDAWGYGISCSHRFGGTIDNTAVYIAGNKCIYNTRKSIDGHGAVGIRVIGNYCTGQIGIMNEEGSDPADPSQNDIEWSKRVTDVLIAENYIFNDLAWYEAYTHASPWEFITVGSFLYPQFFGGGSIMIHNNHIKNCNVSNSRAVIWCAVNNDRYDGETLVYAGIPLNVISIKNNILEDVATHDEYYGYPEEKDGVIFVISGTVTPKMIDISGNNIFGGATNGIKVTPYNPNFVKPHITTIANNNLYGNFTNPIYVRRDLNQVITNNTLNGELLPDMEDAHTGTLRAKLNSSTDPVYKDLLTVNANGWEDGSVSLKVIVEAVSSNPPTKSHASYEMRAIAQNNAGVSEFILPEAEEKVLTGASLMPVLSWEGEDADIKVLRITCPHPYTNYKITVNISCWRIQLFMTE